MTWKSHWKNAIFTKGLRHYLQNLDKMHKRGVNNCAFMIVFCMWERHNCYCVGGSHIVTWWSKGPLKPWEGGFKGPFARYKETKPIGQYETGTHVKTCIFGNSWPDLNMSILLNFPPCVVTLFLECYNFS